MKIEHRFSFFIFQLSEKMNDPNIHAFPDLDFLIETHHEDGFLGSEICFRISRSIAKSEIRISKSKS